MAPLNSIHNLFTHSHSLLLVLVLAFGLTGCREDDIYYPPEKTEIGEKSETDVLGFYLLNSGNMGSNKASLDWYDYRQATFYSDIYSSANPNVPKELGDVGNDIAIYGSRLYAVINCSNKVEVLDSRTARRIGQVDIPNCRYLAFEGPYAYVTSYAGPVIIDEDYAQLGYVAKVDTATLQVVDRCLVGYQPDGIAISGGKIYVANSGGYRVPNYEKTLSVLDLETFSVEKEVEIDINLSQVKADREGKIWVSSRGDYYDNPSALFCYDPASGAVERFDTPVSAMWLDGDRLFTVATSWSNITFTDEKSYAVFDVIKKEKVSSLFIDPETAMSIKVPYGVAVNPVSGQIYVTDAGNYVNPGFLYAFAPDGSFQWRLRAGDIPACIAFLTEERTVDPADRSRHQTPER